MRSLALLLALLPPAGATMACNCEETGSPVDLSAATVARDPQVDLTGDARIECVRRDRADRCTAFWIVPHSAGTVTIALRFNDGSHVEDTIEYVDNTEYPCRGNLRPVHDRFTRL